MREEERQDVLTMHAAGYCVAEVAKLLDRSEATIAKIIAEHRKAEREAHEADYKAMYKAAAQAAAANGDHKPALEWLDRYGAIPESSRQRTAVLTARVAAEGQAAVTRHLQAAPQVSGPSVQIGIALPGQLPGVSVTSGEVSENFTLALNSGTNMRHDARVSDDDPRK